jgi:hypothetical protein
MNTNIKAILSQEVGKLINYIKQAEIPFSLEDTIYLKNLVAHIEEQEKQ